jgi:uncharacterized membrane protein
MRERLEAAFEYAMDHPEALMILGGMFFAFVSIFTAAIDAGTTTSFIRILALGLIVAGTLLYILRLGLRLIIRFFRRLFPYKPNYDHPLPPPP